MAVKCGWCLTGHHDNCAVDLTLTGGQSARCGCECPKDREHTRPESPSKQTNAKAASRRSTTTAPLSVQPPRVCRCGCGTNVRGTARYQPGHDARHVAAIVNDIEKTIRLDPYMDRVARLGLAEARIAVLPTEPLRNKVVARLTGRGML